MGIKSFVAKIVSKPIYNKRLKDAKNGAAIQNQLLKDLLQKSRNTLFGQDHQFDSIQSHQDFIEKVPVRGYEALKPYIDQVVAGKADVLYPGLPLYFAKTSGTTSGSKYIPITKDSIGHHIAAARDALLAYVAQTGDGSFFNDKMIFLQGSPEMTQTAGIQTGRLSGIVYHHVPAYLQGNRKPTYDTNCIEDWETKVDAIVEETASANMSLISGIPPWVVMYFERLLKATGKKTVAEVFPNLGMFVHGGVNFKPYQPQIQALIGKSIPMIETYPASEGFIAFQDRYNQEGLLLNVNAGIFYEFIPANEYGQPDARRLTLAEVELHENYALVLTTNAGLWSYSIGDTVKFIELAPYRILVTGRIKHFISAFGEHVIGEEVENAMSEVMQETDLEVLDYHVAPLINDEGTSRHQWFVSAARWPEDLTSIAQKIDTKMRAQNTYYDDLRAGNMLVEAEIIRLSPDAFTQYMKSIGKLGGQNKPPRLANNRDMADPLLQFRL